jgi:predicted metalloendopeptidase
VENDDKKENLNGLQRASRYLLDSIDPKIDPCTDFYNYACGGWKVKNKIPDYQSSISHYSVMQKRVFAQIQGKGC